MRAKKRTTISSRKKRRYAGFAGSKIQIEKSNHNINELYWIYGKHPVRAALANMDRKKYRLLISDNLPNTKEIINHEIKPEYVARTEIEHELPSGAIHQGMAVLVAPLNYMPIESLCRISSSETIVLILDQIVDPQNIGAIIRSAAAFNIAAIIVTDKNTPNPTGAIAKAASGALEKIPIIRVVNLNRAIELLKKSGFWIIGLEMSAKQEITQAECNGKLAIIFGAEHKGLRKLTSQKCDYLVRININNSIYSLNVSNAAAIAMYEVSKKRQIGSKK